MIALNVQTDIDRAMAKLARLSGSSTQNAASMALNVAADLVVDQAATRIREAGYNIAAGAINKAVTVKRASRSVLLAQIRATGRPIPLIAYSARQTADGVSVTVKNGRKMIQGAFIATMPNGHTGVFERAGKRHKKIMRNGKAQWHGLPLKELYGPSIASTFANQAVRDALVAVARDRFPRAYTQALRAEG